MHLLPLKFSSNLMTEDLELALRIVSYQPWAQPRLANMEQEDQFCIIMLFFSSLVHHPSASLPKFLVHHQQLSSPRTFSYLEIAFDPAFLRLCLVSHLIYPRPSLQLLLHPSPIPQLSYLLWSYHLSHLLWRPPAS